MNLKFIPLYYILLKARKAKNENYDKLITT